MKKGNYVYRFLSFACLCMMLFSAYKLYGIWQEYRNGDQTYDNIYKEVIGNAADLPPVQPPQKGEQNSSERTDEDAPADPAASQSSADGSSSDGAVFQPVDLTALAKINQDAFAWISIPGTNINYPILKSKDNQDYLRTTIEGKTNKAGSIFVDYRCEEVFEGANCIIYGHNLLNGAMFSSLTKYKEESYWRAHPYIYIQTLNGTAIYEIFSCYVTNGTGKTYDFSLETGSAAYDQYLAMIMQNSLMKGYDGAPERPSIQEKIITLSTCTNRTDEERFVVHAKLVRVE